MTRLEKIREHLRQSGPCSTKEIMAAFGWSLATASAALSHARSYGFIEPHGSCPVRANGSGAPMTIWRARDKLIRYPSTTCLPGCHTQRLRPTRC